MYDPYKNTIPYLVFKTNTFSYILCNFPYMDDSNFLPFYNQGKTTLIGISAYIFKSFKFRHIFQEYLLTLLIFTVFSAFS